MSTKRRLTPGTWLRLRTARAPSQRPAATIYAATPLECQAARWAAERASTAQETALGAHVAALLERQRLAAPTPFHAFDAGWMA